MFSLSSPVRSLGFSLFSLFIFPLLFLLVFTGCSGDDVKIELTGQIDHNFSAGTKACLDISGNGKCDTDEPFALTNSDGTYKVTIPVESLDKFPLIVESAIPSDNSQGKTIKLSAPAGKHAFVSPVSTAVQNRVYEGSSLAEAEADVRARYSLPDDVDLYTDYQGGSLEPEPVHALLEAVASDYGFDVAGNMETAEVAADAQRIGGRRVSGARAASSSDNWVAVEVAGSPSVAAVSAVDSGSVIPGLVVAVTAASGDAGVVQSQEAETSAVLASAEDKVFSVAAAASEAAVETVNNEEPASFSISEQDCTYTVTPVEPQFEKDSSYLLQLEKTADNIPTGHFIVTSTNDDMTWDYSGTIGMQINEEAVNFYKDPELQDPQGKRIVHHAGYDKVEFWFNANFQEDTEIVIEHSDDTVVGFWYPGPWIIKVDCTEEPEPPEPPVDPPELWECSEREPLYDNWETPASGLGPDFVQTWGLVNNTNCEMNGFTIGNPEVFLWTGGTSYVPYSASVSGTYTKFSLAANGGKDKVTANFNFELPAEGIYRIFFDIITENGDVWVFLVQERVIHLPLPKFSNIVLARHHYQGPFLLFALQMVFQWISGPCW